MQKQSVSPRTQVTKPLAYLITYKYTRPEMPAHVRLCVQDTLLHAHFHPQNQP